MKVFQCIHKYAPHIPAFEQKYNIHDRDLSFNEIRDLLINDGYASTYILKPALENKPDEVFFTLWDYKRLQYQWAEENNLQTKNLDKIKLAQIQSFKPDVFYNHSPRNDNNFVEKLAQFKNLKKICWDAIITEYPHIHEKYDARVTLFEPYVKYWNRNGLKASLLTPAYVTSWDKYHSPNRNVDVLFYGQYNEKFFSNRNQLILELLKWQSTNNYNVNVHLQGIKNRKKPLINVKGLRRFTKWIDPIPGEINQYALGPIYGDDLYNAIGHSKIVVNAFTNYNGLYKDNMRIYEALGMGTLMIGEDGIYPKNMIPGEDFLTFRTTGELFDKIDSVLSQHDQGRTIAMQGHEKLKKHYSKENQWKSFVEIVNNI